MAAGIALGLAAFLADTTSPNAQPSVSRIDAVENYINSIETMGADFTQIAPDGSTSTGKFYLDRPGRMRLDYDPPSKILLIATGDWRLVYYDGSIKQVTVIPLSQTPLSILLDDEVDLEENVTVTEITEREELFEMTLVRKDAADQGSVKLFLQNDPIRLVSWVVTDPQGYQTQLVLRNIETGEDYDGRLFRWRDPKIYGWPED